MQISTLSQSLTVSKSENPRPRPTICKPTKGKPAELLAHPHEPITASPRIRASERSMEKKGPSRRNNGFVVRRYTRSKVPRMRWTAELQQSFLRAVGSLGGQDSASTFLNFPSLPFFIC